MAHTPVVGDRVLFTVNGQHMRGEVQRVVDISPGGLPAAIPIAAIRTIPGNQLVYVFTDRISKVEPTIDIAQDMEDLRRIERHVFRYTGLSDDHFQSYDDDLYQRGLEGE